MSGTEKTADASWKIPEEPFGVATTENVLSPGAGYARLRCSPSRTSQPKYTYT